MPTHITENSKSSSWINWLLKQILGLIGFVNLKTSQNGRGLYDQSHFKETGKCLERSLLQENSHQGPGYFVHKTLYSAETNSGCFLFPVNLNGKWTLVVVQEKVDRFFCL